jgi:ribosomal protein S18 acetylase RimI-like enzyme
MEIIIRPTDTQHAPAKLFSHKFIVKSRIILAIEDEKLAYSVFDIEPYERDIPDQDNEYGFDNTEPAVFIAEVNGKPAGRIRMVSWWNQFAYVDDIVVNPEYRGAGIGRALLERGIQWARENDFPGVMLETQHDNVSACALYQSCGFVLSGFDSSVYKAIKLPRPETALYWYLIFSNPNTP